MENSAEFLIERIRVNCRWYFGHDVQVITYYYGRSSAWCVVVYHADSTLFSVAEDSTDNDIHLFDCSSNSMYHALQKAQGKIEQVIGKLFGTEEGVGIPTINELPARCGCEHSPTYNASADQEIRVRVLEVKLQALEKKLRDGNTQLGHEDTTGSHGGPSAQAGSTQKHEAMLQSIESRLESIEHGMRNHRGETTIATALVEGELIPESNRSDLSHPSQAWPWSGLTQPRPQPRTERDGTERDDFNSATNMTPSTEPSERSATPSTDPADGIQSIIPEAGPDGLNRAILRHEINRALATAMIGMAGLLGSGDTCGA
ncbi:hypothetical protein Q9L58_008308 [Maublancomyces gigas]|uniref:Uncharacterized protein n=1 Tax=Discina gigas TaxID=1032678 RepID=A0ABR3GA15_9PEZI